MKAINSYSLKFILLGLMMVTFLSSCGRNDYVQQNTLDDIEEKMAQMEEEMSAMKAENEQKSNQLAEALNKSKAIIDPEIQAHNRDILAQINSTWCPPCGWDQFCYLEGDTISYDNGCGSCGHGEWEIGTVSYSVKYDSVFVRDPVGGSHMVKDWVLFIECNDGDNCISPAKTYWGDASNELKLGPVDPKRTLRIVELLNELQSIYQ